MRSLTTIATRSASFHDAQIDAIRLSSRPPFDTATVGRIAIHAQCSMLEGRVSNTC